MYGGRKNQHRSRILARPRRIPVYRLTRGIGQTEGKDDSYFPTRVYASHHRAIPSGVITRNGTSAFLSPVFDLPWALVIAIAFTPRMSGPPVASVSQLRKWHRSTFVLYRRRILLLSGVHICVPIPNARPTCHCLAANECRFGDMQPSHSYTTKLPGPLFEGSFFLPPLNSTSTRIRLNWGHTDPGRPNPQTGVRDVWQCTVWPVVAVATALYRATGEKTTGNYQSCDRDRDQYRRTGLARAGRVAHLKSESINLSESARDRGVQNGGLMR
ncbi:hypothetical protein EDB85DRAFT_2212352 [Lactarius pseudohatsudake]|nr:hypothetical protein EDB85DRAFT_2212352 [Lactarius pseudohatsudake]